MMMNTFSTFDLIIKNNLSILLFIYMYVTVNSSSQKSWSLDSTKAMMINLSTTTMKSVINPTKAKNMVGSKSLLVSLFMSILMLNLASMIPYGPSLTAHLMMDLSLCLPLWVSMMTWSMIQPQPSTANYLPENTMNSIAPFLSMVEIISSVIRPITLSFRLSANISAGHVIMAMMGTTSTVLIMTASKSTTFLILAGSSYFSFEMAICFAQAFVLALLSAIYSNDYHTSPPK